MDSSLSWLEQSHTVSFETKTRTKKGPKALDMCLLSLTLHIVFSCIVNTGNKYWWSYTGNIIIILSVFIQVHINSNSKFICFTWPCLCLKCSATKSKTWPDSSSVFEDLFIVELTSVGTCEGLWTIMGEMTLARRTPRGLADERKEKCYSGSFWFLRYVKNQ